MRFHVAAALHGRLDAYALSKSPRIPVFWENVLGEVRPGGLHLRTFLNPGEIAQPTFGGPGEETQPGNFIVGVFYPSAQAGGGAGPANRIVDEVLDQFRTGLTLTSGGVIVGIGRRGDGPALVEPDWYQIPVRIGYTASRTVPA